MPEKPDNLTFKQTLKMRRNYVGRSCKLHYEVSPLKIVRASRQYMYDDSGNEYLDCINNTSHVGHCHPHVIGAGQEQMSKLITAYGFLTDCQVEYAKRIVELLPESLCVCYFLNSGSEANDLALRLARSYTKQNDVIVVDNAYHGNTENLIKISPSRLKQHNLPKDDWVHIVPVPDTYRGKYREDSLSPGHLYAQEVKTAIRKAVDNGRSVAAFMSEPVMTSAGTIVPAPNYFKYVYRYVREAGGVCIADEIQTGLGRCGEKYWAFESQDVVPDIITLGKPIGNGHPMSIVITTKEISDSLKEFSSTFGGNPVACSMGMAVLDVIKNEQLLSSAKSVGKCLIQGFKAIIDNHRMMGDVRGIGMLMGVEIVIDKESRKPNKDAAELLVYKLKERKVITSNEGPDKNVIIFQPPMCFTCDNARTAVQALDQALTEVENEATQVSQESNDTIQVPLSILTGIKHKLDSDDDDDDDDDDESPNKRKKVSYEEMD
ncbi:5-phosphohydroxy-L-lysine phospho-lyase-like isoform X1 [Ruditapes philippinarum]|uniref:5-phosphohydroxy-L-lysine phospho-lyase-like isoform X1 n=1 Tax=Ruditapes philippinarum TaxID=129788 RepID=UPI00295C2E30|nr:5-phosphohydroxy-L-lysine phospho-lyase-like isoform X1 [Ruditapes philippinarum]